MAKKNYYKKLRKKYSDEEIAESFILPMKLSKKESAQALFDLNESRIKLKNLSEEIELRNLWKEPKLPTAEELSNQINKLYQAMKEKATTQLGFNYVYHFNEFENRWYCISRDSYLNYWSKTMKHSDDWTSGKTIDEAAEAMLKTKVVKVKI